MAISLNNFVDISFTHNAQSTVNGTRSTVVILTTTAGFTDIALTTFSSNADYLQYLTDNTITATTLSQYVSMYFNNGGVKVAILTIASTTEAVIKSAMYGMSDEYLLFAIDGGSNFTFSTLTLSDIIDSTVAAIHSKFLLGRYQYSDIASSDSALNPQFSTTSSEFVFGKYSNVVGAEMTIAAYLSRIQVYRTDTVKDYSYTAEAITEYLKPSTSTVSDDDIYDVLNTQNLNFDYSLAGTVRNIGGNSFKGTANIAYPLVNQYMLIVMQQTLTEKLVNLLATKLKGNTGINSIRSTLSSELNKYLDNGYLTTDKVWTTTDWTVSQNGVEYTIITANTPLSTGYVISILPLTSLTSDELAQHMCPPIYIAIADSYSIRTISVIGQDI